MSLTVNQMANPAVQTSVVVLPKAEQGAPPVQPAPLARTVVESEPLVDQELVRKNLHAAIEKLNEQVESNGRGLNFSMDELLNRPVITVRNTSTGEVVRQIPNEVVIKVAHSIENIKGLLMDQML